MFPTPPQYKCCNHTQYINIIIIFSYYFKTRYKSVVISLWMSYLNEN